MTRQRSALRLTVICRISSTLRNISRYQHLGAGKERIAAACGVARSGTYRALTS